MVLYLNNLGSCLKIIMLGYNILDKWKLPKFPSNP